MSTNKEKQKFNLEFERHPFLRKTCQDVLGALLRELPIEILGSRNKLAKYRFPDLSSPKKLHTIEAELVINPLTKEPDSVRGKIVIDDFEVKRLLDLHKIGLNDKQLEIIANNARNLELLDKVRKKYRIEKPRIMEKLEEVYNKNIDHQYGQPGNVWNILSSIPQMASFILVDGLGNIDGPNANPLGATMVGKDCGQYHSAVVGSEKGFLMVPFVKRKGANFKTAGKLPEGLGHVGELLNAGYTPYHPYNFANLINHDDVEDVQFLPAFVLMSKRSMMIAGSNFQIKMSFGVQITTRDRTMHFAETENAIENTSLFAKLAEKRLLPADFWAIKDSFSVQINDDENTTTLVRSPSDQLISNINTSIPENFVPITAASLFSKNILSPNPLFVDLVEAGFDSYQLFHDIVEKLINTQLELIDLGVVPGLHPQNLIYLIDKNEKKLRGFLMRDIEGTKVDSIKMENLGIPYGGKYHKNDHALGPLPKKDPKLYAEIITNFLHRFILNGNVSPLMQLMNKHFGFDIEELTKVVKSIYIDWWKTHKKTFEDYKKVISPEFRLLNQALSSLEIEHFPLFRALPNHPLIPTEEEMKAILSS